MTVVFDERGATITAGGASWTTGAAGARCVRDLVRQRGEEAAVAAVERATRAMPDVRRRWPGGRGQEAFDITVEGMLRGAGVPWAEVPRLAARYRRDAGASVDLSAFVRPEPVASPDETGRVASRAASEAELAAVDAFRTRSSSGVRALLRERLGTQAFRVEGRRIELDLPDRSESSPTRILRVWFTVPEEVSAAAPHAGSRTGVHAVPTGWTRTLCGIDTSTWLGIDSDPTGVVTCRWCEIRVLAAEVALGRPAREVGSSGRTETTHPDAPTRPAEGPQERTAASPVKPADPTPRAAGRALGGLVRVPLERSINPTSLVVPTPEQILRVRREQDLVLAYGRYLEDRGFTVARLRLPLEETTLINDVYVEERHQLIEAKGSTRRDAIRMAIGQLLDYRFIAGRDLATPPAIGVLLPERPSRSILDLLESPQVEIAVVWAVDDGFDDNAGGAFT